MYINILLTTNQFLPVGTTTDVTGNGEARPKQNNFFMKTIKKVTLTLTAAALMMGGTSCTSYKKAQYMQDHYVYNLEAKPQLYDFRIMPKDELTILVSTSDPEASAPFYRKIGQTKGQTNNSQVGMQDAKLLVYLVDNNGYIDFPILGMLKVEGMTTRECEGMIREHLKGYLNEVPNVSVRSNNYKFSVLGEVGRPGTYTSENEKMTIFEALALAGDMTLFSVRDEVKLMREDENGKRTVYELDLTRADVANSPYFYIQQNDVIYVKPTKAKVRTNTFNSNSSMWITILSVVTSVTSLVLALTK